MLNGTSVLLLAVQILSLSFLVAQITAFKVSKQHVELALASYSYVYRLHRSRRTTKTEQAMEPRVFSGGTANPKEGHRILGLWVRPDAYSGGTHNPVT